MVQLILALGVIGLLIYLYITPRYVFRLRFKQGALIESEGTIAKVVKGELEQQARILGVTGDVRQYVPNRLEFSVDFDPSAQEKFEEVLAGEERKIARPIRVHATRS